MTAAEPYLSVVVASRNDTHGGDPLARLQALVDTFNVQCVRFGLDAEVIVVEWNPPPDRPRLRDAVRMPPPGGISLRFIEVPPELHATLPFSDGLPLFQMMAKNVGIRRARGRFVLSTNIDIICSNELVEFLAGRRLEPWRMYRVDRHDIDAALPMDATLETQMAFCASHQLRVHGREGTYTVNSNGCPARLSGDVVDQTAVTIGDGWHVREGDAASGWYRWARSEAHLLIDLPAGGWRDDAVLDLELEPNPYQRGSWCELEVLEGDTVLARRRISSDAAGVTSFCVALDAGIQKHDIVLRSVSDSSAEGRAFLPLFEGREALAYRLRSARMRTLPLEAVKGHAYTTVGPLLAPTAGMFHFAAAADDEHSDLAILDDENGIARPAQRVEVYSRGARTIVVSAGLQAGDLFWLRPSAGGSVKVFGALPEAQLRLGANPGAIIQTRILGRRWMRVGWAWQRGIRAAMVPALRAWLQRFDPAAPPEPRLSVDERSGTTEEMAAVREFLRQHRAPLLHQNACGDFQLMAREHWLDLRGFAEFPTYSMSLDGLLSAAAEHAGVREQVLEMPRCIYHLEHEKGSGWTPEGEALLRQRLAARGVTWVDHRMIRVWGSYMTWLKRPMIFNGSDWGLGNVSLFEV